MMFASSSSSFILVCSWLSCRLLFAVLHFAVYNVSMYQLNVSAICLRYVSTLQTESFPGIQVRRGCRWTGDGMLPSRIDDDDDRMMVMKMKQ